MVFNLSTMAGLSQAAAERAQREHDAAKQEYLIVLELLRFDGYHPVLKKHLRQLYEQVDDASVTTCDKFLAFYPTLMALTDQPFPEHRFFDRDSVSTYIREKADLSWSRNVSLLARRFPAFAIHLAALVLELALALFELWKKNAASAICYNVHQYFDGVFSILQHLPPPQTQLTAKHNLLKLNAYDAYVLCLHQIDTTYRIPNSGSHTMCVEAYQFIGEMAEQLIVVIGQGHQQSIDGYLQSVSDAATFYLDLAYHPHYHNTIDMLNSAIYYRELSIRLMNASPGFANQHKAYYIQMWQELFALIRAAQRCLRESSGRDIFDEVVVPLSTMWQQEDKGSSLYQAQLTRRLEEIACVEHAISHEVLLSYYKEGALRNKENVPAGFFSLAANMLQAHEALGQIDLAQDLPKLVKMFNDECLEDKINDFFTFAIYLGVLSLSDIETAFHKAGEQCPPVLVLTNKTPTLAPAASSATKVGLGF